MKKSVLKNIDDTTFSNELSRYLRIVKEEGFQELLSIPFTNREGRKETYYIFYHPADGVLLSFCTYGGDSINGGHFFYNWKPKDMKNFHYYVSSGGFREVNGEFIWTGSHDCREAIRRHLNELRNNGEFITPWVESPFLWLLHYMDHDGDDYNYKQINLERISLLPKEVQRAICH